MPNGVDFDPLKLVTGSSDLADKMLDSLERLQQQWEDEDKDIDYGKDD